MIRLTTHPKEDNEAAWSPDGKRIAFSSRRGARGDQDIYVMSADGTDLVRLTSSPAEEYDAAWSPDGKRIALTYERDDASSIWLLGLDRGELTPLTSGAYDNEPDWSPDGRHIAFAHDGDIWAMNADGSHQHEVVDGGDYAFGEPDWSSDGKWLVFEADVGEGIWLARADGSDLRQLIDDPAYDPKWQPRAKPH